MENKISCILNDMSDVLSISQMRKLQTVLMDRLVENFTEKTEARSNYEYMDMFIAAKNIEGCSIRTMEYYKATISNMFKIINVPIRQMTTEDLKNEGYLNDNYKDAKTNQPICKTISINKGDTTANITDGC